jgi:hypothetical protein
MAGSPEDPMSREDEQSLHQRLQAGDATASADLASVFLDYLVRWLRRVNQASVSTDLCRDAAVDALVSLIKSPASFKPERGTRLAAYLRMSAQGDLRNILQREERYHHLRLEDVEHSAQARKYLSVDEDPLQSLEREEQSADATRTIVGPVRDGLSEGESRALDLLLEGERKTIVFAEAMGIAHLPAKLQRAEVNRVKNKLKKRIQRETSGNGNAS